MKPLTRGALVASLFVLGACAFLSPGARQLRGWKDETVALRGLSFDSKPGPELRRVDAAGVFTILATELIRGYPPDYVAAYEEAYKALGLLPRDVDLVRLLLELQTEQIVGLYTLSDDVMYVRNDLGPGAEEVDQIVVHELVHALQARHFETSMSLTRGLRHNDDVAAGIAAAIEGDASFTMLGLPSEQFPLRRDLESARRVQQSLWVDLENPTGVFARAPRLLRRSLLFSYAEGIVLAALRYQVSGNRGLDGLMRDPPLSSLRVYEPADRHPVEFIALPRREIVGSLEVGCFAGHYNVAGALGVQALLEDHLEPADPDEIREVMRGWSGDRFFHLGCPEREDFVWYTRWTSVEAARDFARLYARAAPSIAAGTGLASPPAAEHRGREVLILTAGVREASQLIRDGVEVRSYGSFLDWVADDCFTESPCPLEPSEWMAALVR